MSLIERVAKAAGWEFRPCCEYWIANGDETFCVAELEYGLSSDGLLVLLEELLKAGWAAMRHDGKVLIWKALGPIGDCVTADTLSEAVMLAYLSHKGEQP